MWLRSWLVTSIGNSTDTRQRDSACCQSPPNDPHTSTTTTFSYDRTGQLRSRTDPGGSTAFAYDAYGNLVSSARAFDSLTAYTYDPADRLTGLTTPDSTAYTFTLDALGRPVRRSDGTTSVTYAYVGTGTTAWRMTSGSASLDAALGPDESRLALSDGSAFAWLLPDLHGNVAAGIDSGETTVSDAWRYDGYGRPAASTTSSGLANPWTYQGRLDSACNTGGPERSVVRGQGAWPLSTNADPTCCVVTPNFAVDPTVESGWTNLFHSHK